MAPPANRRDRKMRWIIITDKIDDGNAVNFGQFDDESRHYQNESKVADALVTMPTEFQLLDDDGEVYFEGRTRCINHGADLAFAPLDWAEAYGCTELQYRPVGSNEPWKTL